MTRKEMIGVIADDASSWDLDALIHFARENMRIWAEGKTDAELRQYIIDQGFQE